MKFCCPASNEIATSNERFIFALGGTGPDHPSRCCDNMGGQGLGASEMMCIQSASVA